MTDIFLRLLNISITAGYLVVAVLLVRLLFKKAPKWIRGVLWAIVGVRLVFPFSVESIFSLIPSAEVISPDIVKHSTYPTISSGIRVVDNIVNPVIGSAFGSEQAQSVSLLQIVADIAGVVWAVGLAAMLIYALVSAVRIKLQVRESVQISEGIFACDFVKSPFILGVIRPKIYIPSDMRPETADLIISHEKAHIRRGDHFWKPFGFLLLSVYWFNPLVWLAYIMLCRDIELACDEKVIKNLEKDAVADYSEALLQFNSPRKLISACPIAFGEVGVKERVRSVLSYKKPAFWIIVVALIACAVTAVCLLTNPKETNENPDIAIKEGKYKVDSVLYDAQSLSFAENEDNAPQYFISDGKLYWNIAESGEEMLSSRTVLGKITEMSLTKQVFDDYFTFSEYKDAESVRKNTVKAYRVDHVWKNGNKDFFYLLTQNDGGLILCRGFYAQTAKDLVKGTFEVQTDDPFIRWIERLVPIEPEKSASADEIALREKYPEFFDLDCGMGLTVYIWQMSENSYYCYLVDSATAALSDMSFAFEKGATISEMRAILLLYGIEREKVDILPVVNPLSSYGYEIDDAYTQNLIALFWADDNAPIVAHTPDSGNVSLTVVENNLYAEQPSLTVEWKNLGEHEFSYGLAYSVYHKQDGQFVRMPESDSIIVPEIAVLVLEGGSQKEVYDLSMFTFTDGETYRLCLNDLYMSDYSIDFVY